MSVNNILPKGFKELLEFMETKKGNSVEANEIQEFLQKKHGYSSGTVTGIIKRASERKVIVKLDRGTYELNNNVNVIQNENIVTVVINEAIDHAISTVEVMAGQRIAVLKQDDLLKIQKVILNLKQIKEEIIQ